MYPNDLQEQKYDERREHNIIEPRKKKIFFRAINIKTIQIMMIFYEF
jgi:hypothetical protein